jgi:hypothetical protein
MQNEEIAPETIESVLAKIKRLRNEQLQAQQSVDDAVIYNNKLKNEIRKAQEQLANLIHDSDVLSGSGYRIVKSN